MAKLDQYMQGRTEGMEKEVRFRQKTGISLNVTRQELNKASNKIKGVRLRKAEM